MAAKKGGGGGKSGAPKAVMQGFQQLKATGSAGTGIVGGAQQFFNANPSYVAPAQQAVAAGYSPAVVVPEQYRASNVEMPQSAPPVDAQPSFDWEAWNSQMMQQQAAVWAAMDAMNAQFLQQQQAWMENQKLAQQQPQGRSFNFLGASGSNADQAQVKRRKSKKAASTTNPALSIGSGGAGSGVSLGGASSGSTLGVG